jgi:hypothetical protein
MYDAHRELHDAVRALGRAILDETPWIERMIYAILDGLNRLIKRERT